MTYRTFPAWSHSRLVVGEACRFQALLKFKKKIPEPERPPLPEGKEYPNDRGSRVHDTCEKAVRGECDFPLEGLKYFSAELEKLRRMYDSPRFQVHLEEMWTFDDAWAALEDLGPFPDGPWPDDFAQRFYQIWCRIKSDATVFKSKKEAVVIDFKTGKRYGNEVKHNDQLHLYVLGAALRYPELETITGELWYFDANELVSIEFTRKQALAFAKRFTERGLTFTDMRDFQPSPSNRTCFFCSYKTGWIGKEEKGIRGTGHCKKNPDIVL